MCAGNVSIGEMPSNFMEGDDNVEIILSNENGKEHQSKLITLTACNEDGKENQSMLLAPSPKPQPASDELAAGAADTPKSKRSKQYVSKIF